MPYPLATNNQTDNTDDDLLMLSPKGNRLTKSGWNLIKAKGAWTDPNEYMKWIDRSFKPDPIDAAYVAANAFQNMAKNKVYADSPPVEKQRMVNIPFSGHWKPENYMADGPTAAENRTQDSTQFINNYNQQNGITPTVITPQQRLAVMEMLKNKPVK
jgi:hypothetical protein